MFGIPYRSEASLQPAEGDGEIPRVEAQEIGKRLADLRKRRGISLRSLSQQAGLSAASLSAIERGVNSPTLATLHKILRTLSTDFAGFFSNSVNDGRAPVFPRENMKSLEDAHRQCVLLLPRRGDIRFEMLSETLLPGEAEPEWEVHDFDVGGWVMDGGPMQLEIENVGEWMARKGDAFHIKAGLKHRARNCGRRPLRLVTVIYPPRY